MTSFKDFLVNKSFRWHPSIDKKAVDVEDLGEWAWEQCIGWVDSMDAITVEGIEEYKESEWESDPEPMQWLVHWDIALSCLGEVEVERRLKELKK